MFEDIGHSSTARQKMKEFLLGTLKVCMSVEDADERLSTASKTLIIAYVPLCAEITQLFEGYSGDFEQCYFKSNVRHRQNAPEYFGSYFTLSSSRLHDDWPSSLHHPTVGMM